MYCSSSPELRLDQISHFGNKIVRESNGLIDFDLADAIRGDRCPRAALLEDTEQPCAGVRSAFASPAACRGSITSLRMKSPERPVMNAIGTPTRPA